MYKDALQRSGILKTANRVLRALNLDVRLRVNEFSDQFVENDISPQALAAARAIRGSRPPVIFLHGVMQRSGTVFVGELLSLHPGIHAYPNDIWEFPFLRTTGDIQRGQKQFFSAYKYNIDKIGKNDFLPLFGASMIHYLYASVPEGKTMLLKIPDVRFLNYFYTVFPYEKIILQLRDGRDVVNSTIETWPNRNFKSVCQQWNRSAEMILNFQKRHEGEDRKTMLVRFEEIIADPSEFIVRACEYLNLNESAYPFDKIKEIGVRGSSRLKNSGKVDWDKESKPKNFNPVGWWRKWPLKRIDTCKKICGETLVASGYAKNMDW